MARQRESTEEELREAAQAGARKTLESKFYQQVIGSKYAQTKPMEFGQLRLNGARAAYDNVIRSDDFNKLRFESSLLDKSQARVFL